MGLFGRGTRLFNGIVYENRGELPNSLEAEAWREEMEKRGHRSKVLPDPETKKWVLYVAIGRDHRSIQQGPQPPTQGENGVQ